MCGGTEEVMPLSEIEDEQMAHVRVGAGSLLSMKMISIELQVLFFLGCHAQEPVVPAPRPLTPGCLMDNGVPEWASAFLASLSELQLLALLHAAKYAAIDILEDAVTAQMAIMVMESVRAAMVCRADEEPFASAEQEAEYCHLLKVLNVL